MTQPPPPDIEGIKRAAKRIADVVPPTPLLPSELLSRALKAEVWLKYEIATVISSFKIRGALNAVLHAKSDGIEGVVTASTGNHGQGVAYSARVKGMTADVFLPRPANEVKANMIRAFGGTVHEVGDDFYRTVSAAKEYAADKQLSFVDDGNDVHVMEGAGTVGLEIALALPGIDYVIVPMGGGNLAAGCATAIKALQPRASVVSVQAKGSPAVTESFHARELIQRPVDTVADGLVTSVPPALALGVLWGKLDDAWLATDEELLSGVHTLMESAHALVEPAGAAALVGAWQHRDLLEGKRIVLLLTGANISSALLGRALSIPPLF